MVSSYYHRSTCTCTCMCTNIKNCIRVKYYTIHSGENNEDITHKMKQKERFSIILVGVSNQKKNSTVSEHTPYTHIYNIHEIVTNCIINLTTRFYYMNMCNSKCAFLIQTSTQTVITATWSMDNGNISLAYLLIVVHN